MKLKAAILVLTEALDPNHQGPHWPDPIKWDGRSLRDQAHDLIAAIESGTHTHAVNLVAINLHAVLTEEN